MWCEQVSYICTGRGVLSCKQSDLNLVKDIEKDGKNGGEERW